MGGVCGRKGGGTAGLWGFAFGLLVAAGCEPQSAQETRAVPTAVGDDATPRDDDAALMPTGRVASRQTLGCLAWGLWLPFGLGILSAGLGWAWHRRGVRRAAPRPEGAALRPGPQIVAGRVACDGGDALTLTITQTRAHVRHNGRTRAVWNESRRALASKPFRLVTDSRAVVTVAPDPRAALVTALEGPQPVAEGLRQRTARVRHGARVWVDGTVSESRSSDGVPSWVMQRGVLALKVSTDDLLAHHGAAAARDGRWFWGLVTALAVTHAVLLGDVTLGLVAGRVDAVAVTETVTWRAWVRSKNTAGRWVARCGVRAAGALYETSCGFERCVAAGRCRTVPRVSVGGEGGLVRLGLGPTMYGAQAALSVTVGVIALIASQRRHGDARRRLDRPVNDDG